MTRKVDKLRPYRVDWFDINEMIDNDKVLVRSVVIRAVTAKQAATSVEEIRTIERNSPVVVIRAHRFYKKLLKHRKDVYKAVEDLFTAKQATELMGLLEEYRRKKIDEQFAAAAGQVPADPLADVKVIDPGPNCWSGGLKIPIPVGLPEDEWCPKHPRHYKLNCTTCRMELPFDHPDHICSDKCYEIVVLDDPKPTSQPCGTSEITSRNDYADPDTPTTGPDSPATQAVVADLQGMVDHDAHEQVMDTFVPLPGQGVDFVDKNAVLAAAPLASTTHTPFLTSCPACGGGTCKGDYGQPTDHGDDIAAALTAVEVPPGYVLTDTTPPLRYADPPNRILEVEDPMPLGMKIVLFGIVGFFTIVIVLAILH